MIAAVGGDDPQLGRWSAMLADLLGQPADERHEPVTAVDRDTQAALVRRLGANDTEDVTRPPAAAILGGSAQTVLAAARSVGESTPLLIIPSAADAPAIAYALLPAVDDGRCVMPALPWRWSAAVREYFRRFSRGDLGDLRLLQFERTQQTSSAQVSRTDADELFLQDIDLLRLLGGDYRRITALQIGATHSGARQTTVTLAADAAPEAVWSLSAGDTSTWRLTLSGTRGTAAFSGRADGGTGLSINGDPVDVSGDDPVRVCIERFLALVSSGPAVAADPLAPSWTDFVRAADLLQGLHRSLRRRRTIDLQFDSGSERSQFKSQMAAIGCGVLTWALLGTCAGLILGNVLDPRDRTERRAAAADTILWRGDFVGNGVEPNPEALARVVQKAAADGPATIILIERHGRDAADPVDAARLRFLTNALQMEAGEILTPQLDVRPLRGRWFYWGMLAVWCLTYIPLLIFLLLQGLLAVTRAPAGESAEASTSP